MNNAGEAAEEVTNISLHGVSNGTCQTAVKLRGGQKLAQITFIAIIINRWNRMAIPVHIVAGQD